MAICKFEQCIRCGGVNIDKLTVNTRISLNYPEVKNYYTNAISQRIVEPTRAIVCRDCGHVELLVDFGNAN